MTGQIKPKAEEKEAPADGKPVKLQRSVHDLPVSKVVVHPLVLLSVVDHFNRVSKIGHAKRVVGVLLGSMKQDRVLDVSNSFAVPFEEDEKDRNVWFLDHDYLENMYSMFRKVNAREKVVGWYHSGPRLHPNDILINELIKKFTANPVLVIIDAKPKELGLPTEAYVEVEEVHDDGTPPLKTFEHVVSDISAEEAEEVGVEHLLRDIKDQTSGTLSQRITDKLSGLKGLAVQLYDIQKYLSEVSAGTLPINHNVIYLLQDILNLLPDITSPEFARCAVVQTNDLMLMIYLGSLLRSVVALHNLISNKLSLRDQEREDKAESSASKAAPKKDDLAEKKASDESKEKSSKMPRKEA